MIGIFVYSGTLVDWRELKRLPTKADSLTSSRKELVLEGY
jgi:hypothetical protein